ncbi:YciI family protein [Salinactinospora qingdaonensis]|uniref:YciI family protein n=1 Tax=Salinactinospora qingdaonensis TaxID=702744 RepID=A0ABP7FWF4_9ACTN
MKYMLMICGDEAYMGDANSTADPPGCGGWQEEMTSRGILRGGEGLRPSSDATTVRVRDDEVMISDGPFAETKEQIGGFSLIECADLEEALEVASKHPAARFGTIEVRPIWET